MFYMAGNSVMAVEVDGTSEAFRAGSPTKLFDGPFEVDSNNIPLAINVHDNRFVMLQVHEQDSAGPDRTMVNFVFNWFETLQEFGPASK